MPTNQEERALTWGSDSDAAVRRLIMQFVRDRAQQLIVERLPEWKEIVQNARAFELLAIRCGALGTPRVLTAAERAELAPIAAELAWIRQMRAAVNIAEAVLPGMTRAQLDQWAEPDWPV